MRFPEFTDEWKKVKLGEVAEKQHTKNTDDSIDRVYTNSAQNGIVEQTEFFDKEIANGNNLSGYYIVRQYDFVYNPRLSRTAPVGAMNINKNTGTGLVSPLYTVFRITNRCVINEFLEFLFKSTSWHGYMNEVANFGARSDRMNIRDKDFFNLPLRLPSLPEQRKIASLLSLIDERIETQSAVIKDQEALKAALLRRLFDRTLRFPDFTDEWKEVRLGEVTCERNETNAPTLPLLSITVDKGIIPQTDSEKKDISNADKSKYKRICPGDIGYNTMRMWQGRSALSFVEGIVSPAYTIVTPLEGVSPLFLSYLIKRPRLIYEFWTHSQGLVEDTLNCKYKDFSQITIAIPSLPEQGKIAALLSAIDERLAVEREYAEQLKLQKAYLLREMFI